MIAPVGLLVLVLAVIQTGRLWRNATIFAGWKAKSEGWLLMPWKARRVLAEILGCPQCLAVHLSWIFGALWYYEIAAGQIAVVALACSLASDMWVERRGTE